jgi:hypothetical protein
MRNRDEKRMKIKKERNFQLNPKERNERNKMGIELKLSEHQSQSINDDMLRNNNISLFICDDGINLKI